MIPGRLNTDKVFGTHSQEQALPNVRRLPARAIYCEVCPISPRKQTDDPALIAPPRHHGTRGRSHKKLQQISCSLGFTSSDAYAARKDDVDLQVRRERPKEFDALHGHQFGDDVHGNFDFAARDKVGRTF